MIKSSVLTAYFCCKYSGKDLLVKVALTSILSLLEPINPKSALAPSAKLKASITIDFPAPVSPVKTFKPSQKDKSISLIIAKLFT